MVKRTANKITHDNSFSDSLASEVKMSEIEADTMTNLTVIVLEKYNVLGTYAPEALLGVSVLGYAYRVHSTLRDLKQLAEQNGLHTQAPANIDNGQERDRQK